MENKKDIDFETFGTMKDQRYQVVEGSLPRAYALRMADFNTRTLASMGTDPGAEIDRLSEMAQALSSQSAQQEALGDPSVIESGQPLESWIFQSQAAALARSVLAAARAAGLPAQGKAWGAFQSFYSQLGNDFKATVLADEVKMGINGSWVNALDKLRNADFPELSSDFSPVSEEIKRPMEQPSAYEVKVGAVMSMMQTESAHKALDLAKINGSAPDLQGSGKQAMESIAKSLATFASLAAMRESETGMSWREQDFTERFKSAVDVHLSSVAQTIVATSKAAGLDPLSEPKMLAAMTTAMSLMSSSQSRRTLAWLAGTEGGPDLGDEVKKFAEVAYEKSNAKWKAGIAAPSTAPRSAFEEILIDASVKIVPSVKVDGQHSERKIEPAFAVAPQIHNTRDLGDLSFMGESMPAQPIAPQPAAYDRLYAAGKGAGEILSSARCAVSKFVDTFSADAFKAKAVQAVEAANAWTDGAEQRVKAAGQAGLRATADALDGALAAAGQVADQAKQKMVGVVGDAKKASAHGMGMMALAAREKIPAVDVKSPMSQKTVALLQVASIAGALLVGVSMAPVAGLAAATVGAAAAGYGVGNALNKFAGVFRSGIAELPAKLESFAGKLGARRSEKPAAVEPKLGAGEEAPPLGSLGSPGF